MKILVVDDHEYVRLKLRDVLSKGGHDITLAAGAGVAQNLIERYSWDLAILDTNLGHEDLTGYDLGNRCRERGIPFIGMSMDPNGARWRRIGAIEFFDTGRLMDDPLLAIRAFQEKTGRS